MNSHVSSSSTGVNTTYPFPAVTILPALPKKHSLRPGNPRVASESRTGSESSQISRPHSLLPRSGSTSDEADEPRHVRATVVDEPEGRVVLGSPEARRKKVLKEDDAVGEI